jgi:hypothetical protein
MKILEKYCNLITNDSWAKSRKVTSPLVHPHGKFRRDRLLEPASRTSGETNRNSLFVHEAGPCVCEVTTGLDFDEKITHLVYDG